MRENPNIAGGYTKDSKDAVSAFWSATINDLNTAGPPIKTVAEWKKESILYKFIFILNNNVLIYECRCG